MADGLIGNYIPEDFTIILSKGDFVHRVTGFADGTFITASRLVPASEPYLGADLSAGRVKRRNKSMTIDVTLHQYASSNTVLQALADADAEDNGNTWVFACTVKDTSGQTVFSSNQAILARTPDVTFSTTTETRDWQFFLFGSDLFIGGNTPLSAAEVAAVQATGGTVEDRWKASNQ